MSGAPRDPPVSSSTSEKLVDDAPEVPDYTIHHFLPGCIVWMKEKEWGTVSIMKLNNRKKDDVSVLEDAGHKHPALIIKQMLAPGGSREHEPYIALPISSCSSLSIPDWALIRKARRDLRRSLPIDHPESGLDWSVLQSDPENENVPVLYLEEDSTPLCPRKRSYVKADQVLEVPPVHVRRFSVTKPIHEQPRLDYESFVKVLEYMKWPEDARQLYGRPSAPKRALMPMSGNLPRLPSRPPSQIKKKSLRAEQILNSVRGTSQGKLSMTDWPELPGISTSSAGPAKWKADKTRTLRLSNTLDNLSNIKPPPATTHRALNPNSKEFRPSTSYSYLSDPVLPTRHNSRATLQKFGPIESKDFQSIIAAAQHALKSKLNLCVPQPPSDAKLTTIDFEKNNATEVEKITSFVLAQVHDHYQIGEIDLQKTAKIRVVPVAPGLIVDDRWGAIKDENALWDCGKVVMKLLAQERPSNRVYSFEFSSIKVLFVGSMVVCICFVEE